MRRLTPVNGEKGRENHQLPAWAEITQAWGGWFGLFVGKIREERHSSVNSIEISMLAGRKWGSQRGRRASVLGDTVSVTGFSVAQTGFSVAQIVAPPCVLRPSPRLLASICRAGAVDVLGREIHVFRQVCNNCCITTTKTMGTTLLVVQVVPVVVLKL